MWIAMTDLRYDRSYLIETTVGGNLSEELEEVQFLVTHDGDLRQGLSYLCHELVQLIHEDLSLSFLSR